AVRTAEGGPEQAVEPTDAAQVSPSPRIQVAIVGGGATGVELSAELRTTAQVLSAYGLHKLDPRHDVGIVLFESGPRSLPALQLEGTRG
ncbi:NAD(P)/FAD-dependent oxidoreductase, partial [Burkholderia pseudomallei]